ncbi:hypothetical protein ACFCT7_13335 [Fulvivirgaceae bacterium LMO-SS25]
MELEEMKTSWEQMSQKLAKQKSENIQLIERMTKQQYKSKLNKIGYSEYVGTLVCYVAAAYLSVNLPKMSDPIMQVFALISILLLFALPIISLKSVRGLSANMDMTISHLDLLKRFAIKKLRFQKLQKLNVSLALFLMVIIIPVLAAIQGKVLNDIANFWTIIFPIGVVFFLGFAYWVLRFYNKALGQMQGVLEELRATDDDR